MRVKRRLAVAMAGAVAAAGGIAPVALSAAPAQAATTAVTLPITKYSRMLVDPVHQHLFITSGSGSSSILVTDYSGQPVATIPNEPGATGLALSGDGSTVYAALVNGDAISAISTDTLAETARYATGTGTDPISAAYTSGKIWFGYGTTGHSGIGSIDPGTSPATVTLNATHDPFLTWPNAPMLAASPTGDLVAGETGISPLLLASYDVSTGTAKVLSPRKSFTNSSDLDSFQITPDGKDVVVASGAPYYQQIFQVSNLSAAGKYPTAAYPNSVSIASDGTVAAGVTTGSNEVFLFAPGGSSPLNTYNFGSNELAIDGVALTPDARELFAVTTLNLGASPTLNIITDPVLGGSSIVMTGPATVNHRDTFTLNGTLYGAAPYAGGQTLHVTRTDPTNPNGVALPDVTTTANGSFRITDTPPKVNMDTATVTYQVSYAGDAHLTASTGTFSVTVRYDNS